MKLMRAPFLLMIVTGFFSACVPTKKFQAEQDLNNKLKQENGDLRSQLNSTNDQIANLTSQIDDLNNQINKLAQDTSQLGNQLQKAAKENSDINSLYEDAVAQNKLLLSKSSTERLALLDSIKKKQTDLRKKEDQLDSLQTNLAQREQKLAELQSLLNRKDSATNALRQKIQNALLGFEKSDLTVEQKNGKVYVSLSEKLLFKSGSTEVDPKGKTALQKLAEVLKKNPDINITVEGHTDNVPLAGTGTMKDNWDLSVLRATSIIRILTDYGVDSKQIIASGRGEYFPVQLNSTTEGKAKNRRTEIILTPKLDELAKILGTK
ncbi:MAG: OmpA family protein [Chitinophagales bacterium]|nr:OmpA family protein [Chitinophagales bacterium]